MKIFDAHIHVFPDKVAHKVSEFLGDYYKLKVHHIGDGDTLDSVMSQVGLSGALIHSTATKPSQVKNVNDFISNLVECYEEKNENIVGFGTIHHEYQEGIEDEIKRVKMLGLKGIKLHPEFSDFYIDQPAMFPIYEACQKHKLMILIHLGDEFGDRSCPERLLSVHKMFPEILFIGSHLGGYTMWDRGVNCLAGRKNMYFDTSSSLEFLTKEQAVTQIRRLGVDRCLYGSDFPIWNPKEEVEKLLALGLTREENEKILYENANKLFFA